MMKLVRPFISSIMAFWISTSVRVSTELVASSRISRVGIRQDGAGDGHNCICPCEMLVVSSLSTGL